MYNEHMLTGELSPPVMGNDVDDWPDHAPFVFDDHRPALWFSLVLALRNLPSLGLLVLAVGAALICAMAIVVNAELALSVWSVAPALGLGVLAASNMIVKRVLGRLAVAPAALDRVSVLKHRARRYQVAAPMNDAQARTHDCWRVGHVRQAHAVLDRIALMERTRYEAMAALG